VRVASLHLFPVKSLRGVDVGAAQVDRLGLRGDRRWMVVEADGVTLTARKHHAMLGVRATPLEGGLHLAAEGLDDLVVAEPPVGTPRIDVALSRVGTATPVGPEADAWLTQALGRPVSLVWLDDTERRIVAPKDGGRDGDVLSFADAGPLLVTTTASLAALNSWIAERDPGYGHLPMERFRPNLVVDSDDAFAEDDWAGLRVGDVELRFAERCDRCVLTTVDLATLRTTKEPIRTLARHRSWDGKTWFGVRMIPVTTGSIAVGDPVEVVAG
jgi:uncharacterized protein